MSTRDKLLKVALPIVILLAAALVAVALIELRRPPEKMAASHPGVLVEALPVTVTNYPLQIRASGTVQPAREISVIPQVNGRVVELGRDFAAGSFFAKGELLLRIEPIDYHLAVEQAEASLARAEVELATTESQAAIAREEWQRLGLQGDGEPNPLALYEPQLKNARANLASARTALEQARLNLERTALVAPFAGRVRTRSADLGQYLRAGTPVATFIGSADAEVVVSLPLDDLAWLAIPAPGSDRGGSPARVTLSGHSAPQWEGRIVRLLGEVDPRGRMVQAVIRIRDPYRLATPQPAPPFLDVGQYVDVQFAGPVLEGVVALPRSALRENDTVWVVDEALQLRIRPVEVLRLERDVVLIRTGLQDGEQVVLTQISGAADGQKLRVAAPGGGA